MRIETREELINALMDAAEMEHNLACLYLFAAFSIKEDLAELDGVPTADQQPVLNEITGWKGIILDIALEEMGHLGTVANLLTLLGAEAHFDRPNFPPPANYYPPDEAFTLERFGIGALTRFVEFERHKDQPGVEAFGVAPRGVSYKHVGELYEAIFAAFEEPSGDPAQPGGIELDNADLFLGIAKAMDKNWSAMVEVHDFGLGDTPPTSLAELRAAIRVALRDIIEEGEGARDPQVTSHYHKFHAMAASLRERTDQFPGFDPARNVADNPMSQRHRDAGGGVSLITREQTRDVAELFNLFYGSMLLALRQTYAFTEDLGDRTRVRAMQRVCKQLMKRTIAPLGTLLTRLPLTDAAGSPAAGAGFELYRPLYVSTEPGIAWRVVAERLVIAEAESARLAAQAFPAGDMADVLRNAERAARSQADFIEQRLI